MDPIRRNILATGAAATAMAAASRVFAQQAGQGGAATLVIRGGIVHSVDNPRGEARDIVIEGDTIADIVAPGSVTNVDAEILDAARRLVVPGLINAHTHSHGGLSKGVGDLWSLELLLNAAPWIGGSRHAEDKYLAALINAIEHVEKGSTACYDLFFEFPAPTVEGMEAVASAYEKVGLRAVIAPMVADLTFYQSVPGLIEALPQDARSRARPADEQRRRVARGTADDCQALGISGRPAAPWHRADHPATLHPRIHDRLPRYSARA